MKGMRFFVHSVSINNDNSLSTILRGQRYTLPECIFDETKICRSQLVVVGIILKTFVDDNCVQDFSPLFI